MTDIYQQHDKAFARVSAYVVMKDGKRVATIALNHPRDGAGRLWAYVHWIGSPMVRGFATGYGYDKRTAAVAKAVRATWKEMRLAAKAGDPDYDFYAACEKDSGWSWETMLERAGFTVLQAV
ncbi:hypothetical protein [Terrarubrum flagellatum]|uniref:hypothetical protein n=1 Tax=Terrirubrum flagellatum TaxID=2895980 RepID=UPI003144E6B6